MAAKDIFTNSLPKGEVNVSEGTVFSYPAHTHSHYEMTLYEPFGGGVTVNGEFYSVDTPTVFLLSPADFHRIRVEGKTSARFKKIGFPENGSPLPDRPILLTSADKHPLATELFNEIVRSAGEERYVTELIHTAVRYVMKHGKQIPPALPGRRRELIMTVLWYVERNFTADITLESTAREFLVTPQYLSASIKREVGIGFSAYLADLRLKRAAELLRDGDRSVTDICYECGYRNLSHFIRSFRKKYGLSPREYRLR